jgi:hypothetical protein
MTLPTDGAPQHPCHNLPLRHTRMIGRQALIDSLVQQLPTALSPSPAPAAARPPSRCGSRNC